MIYRPFGPGIYSDIVDDNFFNFIKNLAVEQKHNLIDVSKNLVGNIEGQSLFVVPKEHQFYFLNVLRDHVYSYIMGMFALNQIEKEVDKESIQFHLGSGPWINYQLPGEFNPVHHHSGTLSCVIYITVPKEIENEMSTNKEISIKPCPGNVEFIFGHTGFLYSSQLTLLPKEKDILIFPADLLHQVYPFKSNVERVSVALNIYNLTYSEKVT